MLEAPEDAQNIDSRKLRLESATKRYYLHYVYGEPDTADALGSSTDDGGGSAAAGKGGKRPGGAGGKGGRGGAGARPAPLGKPAGMLGTQELAARGRPTHYGCSAPCEALFEGYFTEPGAARQYIELFKSEVG
jgi:hypothetical protein